MPEHQEGDDPNLPNEAGLCNKGGCGLSDLALCMTLTSVRHITLGTLLMQGAEEKGPETPCSGEEKGPET